MNAEELKHKIKELFGEVTFNKDFDRYAENIKNINETLVPWCKLIKEKKIIPISKSVLGDKIIFIRKIGSSNRCVIIKVINGEFKEVHLGNHAYYNRLTQALGIKKSNSTY